MAVANQPRSFQFWNSISATPADFNLDAGNYGLTLSITGTSATLQKLLPDGVTYVPVSAAITASGYTFLQLPAGQYRLALVAVTALIGEIAKIDTGRR